MTCRKNSDNWGGGGGGGVPLMPSHDVDRIWFELWNNFNCGMGGKKQSIYGVGHPKYLKLSPIFSSIGNTSIFKRIYLFRIISFLVF